MGDNERSRKVAIRIYALAKEMELDNRELVEIVKKAGITGKGSALASLEDDELERVQAFMAGGDEPEEEGSVDTIERPEPVAKGPIKVVTSRRKATGPLAKTAEDEDSVAPEEETEDTEETEETEAIEAIEAIEATEATEAAEPTEEPAGDEGSEAPTEDSGAAPIRREDSLPIGDSSIKVLAKGATAEDEGKSAEVKPRVKKPRKPVIKLASLPDLPEPPKPQTPVEENVQSPEVRLTREAIQSSRAGKRPPLEELVAGSGGPVEMMDADKLAEQSRRKQRGKGKTDKPAGLAGMASARADRTKQRNRREKQVRMPTDASGRPRRRRRTLQRTGKNTAAPRKSTVVLELPCTVRSFSEAASIPASQLQAVLMNMGMMVTINAQIDDEFVEVLATELGVELEFRRHETLEESLLESIEQLDGAEGVLVERPPVVTFLGHVDHGKTSLLDAIIGINVVSGEAGGITQHIRAYQVEKGDQRISFVDTPGHEAFTEMRARGANVTDIAVLVIAADDGIMPQTEEAISHAKAAGVPIVVALNKMDLPGANPEQVMTQLTQFELTPSEWGGDTEIVKTSAETGDGLDELMETILAIAELHEYKANPERAAVGVCLEAEQEAGRGVIAKMIVKAGTLNVGDVVVCGTSFGRIKAMYDTLAVDQLVDSADPSMPVNVTGLDSAPEAGETFYVLKDIAEAREIADQRHFHNRESSLSGITTRISFDDFQQQLEDGSLARPDEVATINLIIRADVRGSIEAIRKELEKLYHNEVQVRILQASVGGITAADVMLAHASDAVVIGFNAMPNEDARSLADEKQVEIRRYSIIYKLTEELRSLLEGKLKPEEKVVEMGHAVVQRIFSISRLGNIAGCFVARGTIQRGCKIRVNRDGRTIGEYALDSLRREKDDAREVTRGLECGIKLAGFNDIKKDDVLEAYTIEEVARTL